jgi:hypothetical protein
MAKPRTADRKRSRAASATRARHPGAAPPPRHRSTSTQRGLARKTGVSGAKTGTLSGRTRKKPKRALPARSAAERRARAERFFGAVATEPQEKPAAQSLKGPRRIPGSKDYMDDLRAEEASARPAPLPDEEER